MRPAPLSKTPAISRFSGWARSRFPFRREKTGKRLVYDEEPAHNRHSAGNCPQLPPRGDCAEADYDCRPPPCAFIASEPKTNRFFAASAILHSSPDPSSLALGALAEDALLAFNVRHNA